MTTLFQQSSLPTIGEPCTLDQLADYICDRARACPHADACAAQPVDPDAKCFALMPDA